MLGVIRKMVRICEAFTYEQRYLTEIRFKKRKRKQVFFSIAQIGTEAKNSQSPRRLEIRVIKTFAQIGKI